MDAETLDRQRMISGFSRGMRPFGILVMLVILSFMLRPAAFAGVPRTPGLTAALDRDAAEVGAIVTLTLTCRLPKGARLPPRPEVGGLDGLTVVDRKVVSGKVKIRLLVDRLGSWKTGPLSISYMDKAGKTHELGTGPVSLRVGSNLGDDPRKARLRPIRGILPTRPLWKRYLPWMAGIAGALLVAGCIFFCFRKRRPRDVDAFPADPPHVRARREIEALAAAGIFERGDAREFYFRLSEIVRRYLGALRGFPAVEMTTEEIAARLKTQRDRGLLPLLRYADLVKFSDAAPSRAKKDETVKQALSYIEETCGDLEGGPETGDARRIVP